MPCLLICSGRVLLTVSILMIFIRVGKAAQLLQISRSRSTSSSSSSSSARCRNDGSKCRCSKMNPMRTSNEAISLCTRPHSSSPDAAAGNNNNNNVLTMRKCTVELCDLPFRCDCDGAYMCHIGVATQYWTCAQEDERDMITRDKIHQLHRQTRFGNKWIRRRHLFPEIRIVDGDENMDDAMCSCLRKTRHSASYPLRVIGTFHGQQQPSSLCDWDDDFWA